MNIIKFIAPVVLWIFAIVISTGKANFLIAGYNTETQKEKEMIDEKALAKFMGKFLFVLGLIQLVVPMADVLDVNNFRTILTWTNIIFILVTMGGVIYINTGKRFQK